MNPNMNPEAYRIDEDPRCLAIMDALYDEMYDAGSVVIGTDANGNTIREALVS